MKTNEIIINEVRNSRLLNEKSMHMNDYIMELVQFQKNIARIAFDTDEVGNEHIDEISARLKMKAREYGVMDSPAFIDGIIALKTVGREISISMSGTKGENSVAKALEYVSRQNVSTFRNLNVYDEDDASELDNVVLTDNGIIILEVKRTKKDITITEEGRLFFGSDECYEKYPLGQKMERKRRLLYSAIQKELEKSNLNIALNIDSFVVFSIPQNARVYINDLYKKEKNCRQGKLRYIIDEYDSDIKYSKEEMEILKNILFNMETCQKGFEIKIDYKRLFDDILGMVSLFEEKEKTSYCYLDALKRIRESAQLERKNLKKKVITGLAAGATAATVLIGVAIGTTCRKAI